MKRNRKLSSYELLIALKLSLCCKKHILLVKITKTHRESMFSEA